MGILSSSLRAPIESSAFPAPRCSYNDSWANFRYIENNPHDMRVACMFYQVNNLKTTIIYSHGNGCDIGHMDSFLRKLAIYIGTNVVSYDYVGYGLTRHNLSNVPSEQGCVSCIETVYDFLSRSGVKPKDIILYGTSIGTGPTVRLASDLAKRDINLKGVLLQTPYTSAVGVVSESVATTLHMSNFEGQNPDIFRSIDLIQLIKCPVTIIHGTRDQVIPYNHSKNLAKKNKRCRLIIMEGATHNNIESLFSDVIENSLKDFI